MKYLRFIILSITLPIISGCVTKFLPEINEDTNLVVVEGLITDQYEPYTIKLSSSMQLGKKLNLKPLRGCTVTVTDDQNNSYSFKETATAGTYKSDITKFRGTVGRKYTLHVNTNNSTSNHYSYQSTPMEIKPVPPIDTLYWEKVTIKQDVPLPGYRTEGCKIYLNSNGTAEDCKFYRWDFDETWEMRLMVDVKNRVCWITDKSNTIKIKNTTGLAENKIEGFELNYVTNETDRLSIRYSMLVNQYSLNEDEYLYWDRIKAITDETGSLYDLIPSAIQGNMSCIEDPEETVLGYFSVSAKKSKRIFVRSSFNGLVDMYADCATQEVGCGVAIPGLNNIIWVLYDLCNDEKPHRVLTDKKGCVDCTVRGTTVKPDFWPDK